jgi:hypothetical protein
MIAVLLRGELESERFGPKLRSVLARDGADFESADDAYRRALLEEHRAYESRDGLFGGFPRDVEWFRAALTRRGARDPLHRLELVAGALGRHAQPARGREADLCPAT